MDCQAVLRELESLGTAQNRKIYRRHGVGENLFGVSYANQNKLAKEIKRNHALARELWTSGNHDARILATMIADPSQTDALLLDSWVTDLDSYVVTDAFSGLVGKTALAYEKAEEWTRHEAEWPGRAGWHLVAHLAMKNPALTDAYFSALLAVIEGEIHDRKNRVRDAMNNALIAIGIRNDALEQPAPWPPPPALARWRLTTARPAAKPRTRWNTSAERWPAAGKKPQPPRIRPPAPQKPPSPEADKSGVSARSPGLGALVQVPGRVGLAQEIMSPAGDLTIVAQAAGVQVAAADGDKSLYLGRLQLIVDIPAPAGHGTVAPQPTGKLSAAADGDERFSFRRPCLAVTVVAPADGGAITSQSAGMLPAAADLGQDLALRRRQPGYLMPAPAYRGPVRAEGAGMPVSAADGGESLPRRRDGLPVAVAAPTDRRVVRAQTAYVGLAAADHLGFQTQLRRQPAPVVQTPARRRAGFVSVGADAAGKGPAAADCRIGPVARHLQLPADVAAPAPDGAVGEPPASMPMAAADVDDAVRRRCGGGSRYSRPRRRNVNG